MSVYPLMTALVVFILMEQCVFLFLNSIYSFQFKRLSSEFEKDTSMQTYPILKTDRVTCKKCQVFLCITQPSYHLKHFPYNQSINSSEKKVPFSSPG